jgi:hypothetical protein
MRARIDRGGTCRLLRTELAVPAVLALIPASTTALTAVAVAAVAAMNHSLVVTKSSYTYHPLMPAS